MNNIKVAIMMIGLMALFMVTGFMVGGPRGVLIAFIIATIMNFVTYWYSDKMILRMYKAKEVTEKDHPRFYRVVKKIITPAMMPMPRIYVIPTRAPNAFATGRDEENAAVAATEGLLELLSEDELEGVMGHEIAHIRNKDMLIGTIAATFAGAIGILATIVRFGAIFGGYSRSNERDGGLVGLIIAAFIAPLIALVVQSAISRQREFKADAEGGRLTGKYMSLASALEKLHRSPIQMKLDKRPATANLMISNPLSGKGISSFFSTHPPVEKRIEKLKELAQTAPYAANV